MNNILFKMAILNLMNIFISNLFKQIKYIIYKSEKNMNIIHYNLIIKAKQYTNKELYDFMNFIFMAL